MEESEQIVEQTTTEEQQSEEQSLDETSSEQSDNTTEESTQEPEVKKPSRAQERIQDLVKERNYYKQLAQGKQAKSDDIEGVDETGIDPNKFAQSITKRTESAAERIVNTRLEAMQAEQDFPDIKTSKVLQNMAKGYVSDGLSPYEAAAAAYEDYQAEIKTKEQSAAKRVQADKTLRSSSFTPSGNTTGKSEHIFTQEEISRMSPSEYEQNREKIFVQMNKGLID